MANYINKVNDTFNKIVEKRVINEIAPAVGAAVAAAAPAAAAPAVSAATTSTLAGRAGSAVGSIMAATQKERAEKNKRDALRAAQGQGPKLADTLDAFGPTKQMIDATMAASAGNVGMVQNTMEESFGNMLRSVGNELRKRIPTGKNLLRMGGEVARTLATMHRAETDDPPSSDSERRENATTLARAVGNDVARRSRIQTRLNSTRNP